MITADIPLAALVMGRDPRGDLYTSDTVGDCLAMPNLMKELCWAGVVGDGPSAYHDVDRRRCSQAFNQLLAKR